MARSIIAKKNSAMDDILGIQVMRQNLERHLRFAILLLLQLHADIFAKLHFLVHSDSPFSAVAQLLYPIPRCHELV